MHHLALNFTDKIMFGLPVILKIMSFLALRASLIDSILICCENKYHLSDCSNPLFNSGTHPLWLLRAALLIIFILELKMTLSILLWTPLYRAGWQSLEKSTRIDRSPHYVSCVAWRELGSRKPGRLGNGLAPYRPRLAHSGIWAGCAISRLAEVC